MSVSRKNWKALSSLTRQWTLEDEEEVERERRRRVRSSTSTTDDPDSPTATESPSRAAPSYGGPSPSPGPGPGPCPSPGPGPGPSPGPGPGGVPGAAPERAPTHGSGELESEDFVEVLRLREEKRRLRHQEMLRKQRAEDVEEEEEEGMKGASLPAVVHAATKPPRSAPPSGSLRSNDSTSTTTSSSSNNTTTTTANSGTTNRQHGNGVSRGRGPEEKPSSASSRKFVSSVRISLDSCTTPTERSPRSGTFSPLPPLSPAAEQQPWGSPCHSPSPRGGPRSPPVQNGYAKEAGVRSSSSSEPPTDPKHSCPDQTMPSLAKQSSRTSSFRMLKKKEGDTVPLRRSTSVRLTSRKFESHADPDQEDEKTSTFQRNTKQRVSSRAIQEKMERLAQAAQKLEVARSPDATQRTLVLLEEVSRKRDLFEKDTQTCSPTGPGVSRQDVRSFTSGISERVNRWMNKAVSPGSSPNPADLRHVDISSKKILFECKQQENSISPGVGKISRESGTKALWGSEAVEEVRK